MTSPYERPAVFRVVTTIELIGCWCCRWPVLERHSVVWDANGKLAGTGEAAGEGSASVGPRWSCSSGRIRSVLGCDPRAAGGGVKAEGVEGVR